MFLTLTAWEGGQTESPIRTKETEMSSFTAYPSFLTSLAALMHRATRERRILPATLHDDMHDAHLAESYLISTPPQLFASQRRPLL